MFSFLATFLGLSIYQNDTKIYQTITVAWLVSIGVGITFYLLYFFFKTKSVKNTDKAFKQIVIQGVIGLILCVIVMPVAAKTLEITGVVKRPLSQTTENTKFVDDYKLFGMVNDYRSSQKLNIVSQDDETCKVAQKRIDNYFWQNDLNISNYKDVCPTCISLSVAESQSNYDLNSILNSWKENKDTLSTLKITYKYGCVKTSGGNVALVMVNKSTPQKTTVVTNSDPIVDCVSSAPNCNGESIKLKQSQCKNITCCGFKNGIWKVYSSSEKCTQAQNAEQPTQQVKMPTTPTNQMNFYCYDNTLKYSYYTSSGEQCNKNNLVSSCKGIAKSTYDMCMKSCLDTANSDW